MSTFKIHWSQIIKLHLLLQIYPRKFQVQDDQMWDFGAEATDLLSCYPLVDIVNITFETGVTVNGYW